MHGLTGWFCVRTANRPHPLPHNLDSGAAAGPVQASRGTFFGEGPGCGLGCRKADCRYRAQRLSLRQNAISTIEFPDSLGATLQELDLYDNLIAHIKGLENLTELKDLDLSFNKIKHIKRLNHLKKLKDLYFVQNKISTIENLEGLTELRNLELGANRIRV